MEELTLVITKALLFDLSGPKVLAERSFIKQKLTQDFLLAIVDKYSELMSELAGKPVAASIDESLVYLSRVNESTLVVATTDSMESIEEELQVVESLGSEMRNIVSRMVVRDAKNMFVPLVDGMLRGKIHICFVCNSNPSPENQSGSAALRMAKLLDSGGTSFSNAAKVGPFDVHVTQMTINQIDGAEWNENLELVDVFAYIVYPPFSDDESIGLMTQKIRSNTSAKLLVVPGSDTELEGARDLESSYFMELCDSVSSTPSDLILSVLATSGYTDMHPELAREIWSIDDSIDAEMDTALERAEPLGHQAFFIIDKTTGVARFTYLYDKDAVYMATAPNVVAAISQFQLDASPTSTSVFSAGGLKYALIERDDIVFTLITGDKEDVEVMRERFSFLPDLYLDEAPENKECSGELFKSPPFTLKLLATIPPEDLPGRIAPQKLQPPDWERFESALVKDFLQAVWSSLDGHKTISDLTSSTGGPDMVMGAIHLLRRMEAIDWKVRIFPEDVPHLVSEISEDIRALYSHVDNIVALVDGQNTINAIGAQLGFEESVLLTVFGELHRRGNISFKE
ncbi:MAG: hypothetical protein ACW960_00775 [Candidatus Thorarchaeota archaeon]